MTFADKVKTFIKNKNLFTLVEVKQCQSCLLTFEDGWKLKRHLVRCRGSERHYTKLIVSGEYKCMICSNKYNNKDHLKSHIFITHSDIQVKSKYNRSIEKLLGAYCLERCRAPIMKKLVDGNFHKFLLILIDPVGQYK